MGKKRLDARLMQDFPEYSRTQLQGWVMQGKVFVDGNKLTKPGVQVADDAVVELRAEVPRFVSRAGLKLEKALDYFGVDPTGLVVLDAGLSTGGFSDCLLQRGAKKIYGVDVGYGQVHEKIRQDERVEVLERVNLRTYEHAGDPLDLVTLDLSFISLLKVLDSVKKAMKPSGQLIALIKPQFEADHGQVPAGGVIKDAEVRECIVKKVVAGLHAAGFSCSEVIESPITGTSGNVEYLVHCTRVDA